MANEKRSRTNNVGGLIEDNPLTNVATTLTSAALSALPVIDTTNHAVIVLDPDGLEGAPEIVYVTAHTSGATTATIARAQEGSSALQHSVDVPWVHTPTVLDFGNAAWTTYVPTWTGASSNPVLGNGVIHGAYRATGTLLAVRFDLLMGSTTTFGSGNFRISLPSPFTAATGVSQVAPVAALRSGLVWRVGMAKLGLLTTLYDRFEFVNDNNGTEWNATTPHTWTTNDRIILNAMIEVDP